MSQHYKNQTNKTFNSKRGNSSTHILYVGSGRITRLLSLFRAAWRNRYTLLSSRSDGQALDPVGNDRLAHRNGCKGEGIRFDSGAEKAIQGRQHRPCKVQILAAVFFSKVHNRFQPLKMENAKNERSTRYYAEHRLPIGEVNDLGIISLIERSVEQKAKRLKESDNPLHA